ncbi:InlB B-repeat-containing protein [Bifidobacterium oedipodis]|uniref:DUF5648 domain-containing protein n=1 Tax=Bifidobacterium oedipodis TaxID=2675322 RepID=A0A7Y0ERB0_9BIFI|nr:InlB B-repeat-containing protein [Bifidobacterium sp. DSM 109957]NMM95000.1 hypothetical protein [Bifidobacterium sp. DSM 109957]
MTGNKNVWRAPLAGLASVAMLATMGVAAGTANAASASSGDATITFKTDGGVMFSKASADAENKESDTFTVKADKDGSLADEFAAAEAVLPTLKSGAYTGWYEAAGKSEAVLSSTKDDTSRTVYLHYSDNAADIYNVTINTNKLVSGGESSFQVLASDGISTSQVPSQDVQDGKVVKNWKNGNNDFYTNVTDVNSGLEGAANQGTHNIVLTAQAEDAWVVTFSGKNAIKNADSKWDYALYDSENNELAAKGAEYKVDVKKGAAFEGTVVAITGDEGSPKQASKFYTKQANKLEDLAGSEFDPSSITKNVTVYPGDAVQQYEVTFNYNDQRDDKSVVSKVAAGETVAEPAGVAYNYGKNAEGETLTYATNSHGQKVHYEFAGWYTDASLKDDSKYDFSSKVEKAITLYAKWSVTEIGIDFDPNYGVAKTETKWFADGDVFQAPEFSRDGFVIDTWTPAGYETWVNAVLTIKGDELQGRRGNAKNDTLKASVFQAQWVVDPNAKPEDLKATLENLEKKVTIEKDGKYIKGEDQDDFTAESFDQYVTDYQKYLKDKGNPSTNNDYAKLIDKLETLQAKLVQTAPVKVYRLYNQWNGDHLYTTSSTEYKALAAIGWTTEGVQFNVTDDASFGTAVYRLYNPFNGEHLLTADKDEAKTLVKGGWQSDASGDSLTAYFYAPQGATTGVTRLFNPYVTVGTHLYTTDADEIAKNVKLGWIQEDVLFNVVK